MAGCMRSKGFRYQGGPCGRCPWCINRKAWIWKARSLIELRKAHYSVFVTLTFRREAFATYAVVQKWLKRVRKAHPTVTFRYMAVLEHGERRGRRHYHLLVCCDKKLHTRLFRKKWTQGWTACRIAKATDARYVTKYITKQNERPRASNGWGSRPLGTLFEHPMVVAFYKAFPSARFRTLKVDGVSVPWSLFQRHHKMLRLQCALEREERAEVFRSFNTEYKKLRYQQM